MKFLFALLLIVVGVAQISAARHTIDAFSVHSIAGNMSDTYPMTDRDWHASRKAVQHVEYFRRNIHTGIDRIPPLDPFRVDALGPIILDGQNSNIKGTVYLSDLEVTGAAAFSVNEILVYLTTRRLDFDMIVPVITAKAHFSGVDIVFNDIMFNISGNIEVGLEDYRVAGGVCVAPKNDVDRYAAQGLDVEVSVGGGWYQTSIPIGEPIQNDVDAVRDAVYQTLTSAVLAELTAVLADYPTQQFDIFMEP